MVGFVTCKEFNDLKNNLPTGSGAGVKDVFNAKSPITITSKTSENGANNYDVNLNFGHSMTVLDKDAGMQGRSGDVVVRYPNTSTGIQNSAFDFVIDEMKNESGLTTSGGVYTTHVIQSADSKTANFAKIGTQVGFPNDIFSKNNTEPARVVASSESDAQELNASTLTLEAVRGGVGNQIVYTLTATRKIGWTEEELENPFSSGFNPEIHDPNFKMVDVVVWRAVYSNPSAASENERFNVSYLSNWVKLGASYN